MFESIVEFPNYQKEEVEDHETETVERSENISDLLNKFCLPKDLKIQRELLFDLLKEINARFYIYEGAWIPTTDVIEDMRKHFKGKKDKSGIEDSFKDQKIYTCFLTIKEIWENISSNNGNLNIISPSFSNENNPNTKPYNETQIQRKLSNKKETPLFQCGEEIEKSHLFFKHFLCYCKNNETLIIKPDYLFKIRRFLEDVKRRCSKYKVSRIMFPFPGKWFEHKTPKENKS